MMTDHTQETKIAVLEAKVDHMMNHVTELTKRVRAVEKVCAIVSAVGIGAGGIVGTTVFAPKADAMPTHMAQEWISKMRDWEAEKDRLSVEEMINNSLAEAEIDYGSYDPPKPEVVLQFPSDEDRQGIGWGYDRCHHRPWIRFTQERTGKDCGSGYSREKN